MSPPQMCHDVKDAVHRCFMSRKRFIAEATQTDFNLIDVSTSSCFELNGDLILLPFLPEIPPMERWAVPFLAALLQLWRQHEVGTVRDRFQDQTENVREVVRNVMTFVGPRLSGLCTLWSVLTAFRIAFTELQHDKDAGSWERLEKFLDGSPISGAAIPMAKRPMSNLVYNCPFCSVLSEELGEALQTLRFWMAETPDLEGLHSGLEDIILFLVDLHNNILIAQRATPGSMTGW